MLAIIAGLSYPYRETKSKINDYEDSEPLLRLQIQYSAHRLQTWGCRFLMAAKSRLQLSQFRMGPGELELLRCIMDTKHASMLIWCWKSIVTDINQALNKLMPSQHACMSRVFVKQMSLHLQFYFDFIYFYFYLIFDWNRRAYFKMQFEPGIASTYTQNLLTFFTYILVLGLISITFPFLFMSLSTFFSSYQDSETEGMITSL